MKRSVKRFLCIHLPVLAAILLYFLLPIRCPILTFCHVPCPTCGMTRALFSLLKLDFAGYLHYNPAALPFAALVLFGVHARLIPWPKRRKDLILISGTVIVVIVYILRLHFVGINI